MSPAALMHYAGSFDGKDVRFYVFRGRICVLAATLGALLGYAEDGRALARVMRQEWSDELTRGEDFDVLTGEDLREFKAAMEDAQGRCVSSTARLTILYESGVDVVCLKTEKSAGKELRRFLKREVLPRLRRGEPVLPTPEPAPVFAPAPKPAPAKLPPGSSCALCLRPDVEQINAAIRSGESARSIERRFAGVGKDSVTKHKIKCLGLEQHGSTHAISPNLAVASLVQASILAGDIEGAKAILNLTGKLLGGPAPQDGPGQQVRGYVRRPATPKPKPAPPAAAPAKKKPRPPAPVMPLPHARPSKAPEPPPSTPEPPPAGPSKADLVHGALVKQGFKKHDATRTVRALGDRVNSEPLPDLVRAALAILHRT